MVDPEKSRVFSGQTVKIESGKITSISTSQIADMQAEGWHVVDAKGLYMCPGLIDCESTRLTSLPR